MKIARGPRHTVDWGHVLMEEISEDFQDSGCDTSMQISEDDVIRLQKFVEGVLVGGHILVMIFSLCGNTAALIIVLKSKAPKLSTKYFLTCLAISDLLMTLSAPPTEIGKLMNSYGAWVFGSLLCVLIPCVQLIAATMSAFCLMAIAVERNLLIVVAMHANSAKLSRLWDKLICPLISVSIIAIPVACGLPNLWSYTHVSFLPIPSASSGLSSRPTPSTEQPSEEGVPTTSIGPNLKEASNGTCDLRYHCLLTSFDEDNIIYYSVTGGTYFVLLACFLVCYISIYRFVKKHGHFRKQHQETQSHSTRRFSTSTSSNIVLPPPPSPQEAKLATAERHRKTLRLILGLILLHICCRFPNWLYLVITNVIIPSDDPETQLMVTLRECLHLLSAINSALNPFLYVIWNHSLRATADGPGKGGSYFGCCRWNRRNHHHGCSCHTRFYHRLQSICCCGRYAKRSIGDRDHPSSFDLMGNMKTPKIYYVAESGNNHANHHQHDLIPSVSTQKVFLSDRSLL